MNLDTKYVALAIFLKWLIQKLLKPLQIHKNRCRITSQKNSNDLFNIYACIWLFKKLTMEIYVYVHIPLHAIMHMYIRKINYKQTDVTKVIFKNLSNKTRWKMCVMEFSLCGRNNTFLFYEKGRNGIINMYGLCSLK